MRYPEFKSAIQKHLQRHRQGATWNELREKLSLPYDRPCPEWTRRKTSGRALLWQLQKIATKQS